MTNTQLTIKLQAGQGAFGDGAHPTTRGMMAALEALAHLAGPKHALDVGCGAGILAMQMAYLWHIPVIATDIEASAVQTTIENARANQLADLITVLRADGVDHPAIRAIGAFDIITCNILVQPLMRLALDLCALCPTEGVMVVSGILIWQQETIEDAFTAQGLTLLSRFIIGDWVTLLWQRQSE